MKRRISFLLAMVMCCSLIISALPTAANAIVMDFISDRPVERPAERKISLSMLKRMAQAADEEFITASIWLNPLPQEQLEALVPLTKPNTMVNEFTTVEWDAWSRALSSTRHSIYAGMTSAFRERYLDETVEIRYTNTDSPGFQVYVQKSKLISLAALDEVLWITSLGTHVYLEPETPALEKIAAPVLDFMDTAAPDERVPIRLWLRGESDEEAESLNPISYPTFASTAEEVQAYRTALQQAYREFGRDPIGIFVRNHLDEEDEILFQGQKTRNLIVTVPVSKIASLASLQIVSQIDPAFGYDEAFPDPELPENPDEQNKLEDNLLELMTVARHDERIPVSLQLQTPQNPVIGECVENVLDETDQIVGRFTYSNVIQVLVPKYKIAALAHLGEVASIGWAFGYDARVYAADGGEVVYVPASDTSELSDKIDWGLRVKMIGTTDETRLRVRINLDAPTLEQVQAANPLPEHMTLDEYAALTDTIYQKYLQARAVVYEPFVESYLNAEEEQVDLQKEYSYVLATLSKTKIAALARLDEVQSIQRGQQDPLVPVIPPAEPGEQVVPEKIESRLQREMDAAADDEIIRILLWLNAPSHKEIDATVPPPEDPSDPEQCNAFISAAYRARSATEHGITEAFVRNHMSKTNELLAAGTNAPYLLIATTKSRILSFTALDEVRRIDQYGIPVFAQDDVPQIPTGEPELCEHEYVTVVTAPTCTERGYTTYTCTKCGNEYVGDEVPMLRHDWGEGAVTVEPTEETEGVRTYTCTRCGVTKTETIPVKEHVHTYTDVVTAPTCTEAGFTTHTCVCGDSYVDSEVAALGHDFQDGVCTRCGAWDDLPSVISVDLQEQMKIMADDARVMVAIDLKGLDQNYVLSEIAREMGVDLETLKRENSSGDTLDYVLAKRAVLKRLYGEYNGAFLAEYLPDLPAECRRYVAKTHAALVLSLTKAEILRLAQEEQVIAMRYISPEEMDAVAANDAASLVVPFLFDDVKNDSQFYYVPVYWAVEQKITKGTSEKLFSPNDSCTRAQVVTFLWRAAGEPEPAETVNPFKDVDADAYYSKAVLWAVEQGVTKGTSADKFSPEKTCTRAQIVTFLYRANGSPELTKKENPFKDVAEGEYYADAVAWAVENGITTGKSAETFAPNATCTRAEVVTFLYRSYTGPKPQNPDTAGGPPVYYTASSVEELTQWIKTAEVEPSYTWGSLYPFLKAARDLGQILAVHPASEDYSLQEILVQCNREQMDYFFIKGNERLEVLVELPGTDGNPKLSLDERVGQINSDLALEYESLQYTKASATMNGKETDVYYYDGGEYTKKGSEQKELIGPSAIFEYEGHVVLIRGIGSLYGCKWDSTYLDLFQFDLVALAR